MHTPDIQIAQLLLESGNVVAIPTETVYGLAANIYNQEAIEKIYTLKKRPRTSPLIVHVDSVARCETLVTHLPDKAKQLMDHFWPGPLTVLLPKSAQIPEWITGESNRVGIRMPQHPLTLALIKNCGFPLAAPSANPFSKISPTSAEMVRHYFEDQEVFVLDGGPSQAGLESTIVGFEDDQAIVYRLGALSLEDLEAVIGSVDYADKPNKVFFTPGRFPKHYAPNTPVILTDTPEATAKQWVEEHAGKAAVLSPTFTFVHERLHPIQWPESEALDRVASHLYRTLFELDQQGFDCLIITPFPEEGLGKTMNDRLKRAATK
ncbi:L-threonylcarbamoyladenylate synthase [Flavobacterium sp.]|jgi:L-threonylcarbamoyladenylate synthase|uniref:L-threonylcarbamoyladenylate synthase n=1 Tax=Flavobacterium sp. TaxID=239 RepID=UPI00333E77FF